MLDMNYEIVCKSKEVYSFDVFDTCLTRTYSYPTDLFYDLAPVFLKQYCLYGYDDNSIKLFVSARKRAERQIRNINKQTREDITLIDIYKHLQTLLPWNFDIDEAINLEMDLEKRSLKPILPIKALIDNLRAKQHRIIFISDMYLPCEFIKQCLLEHNIAKKNDAVYVSGDTGSTKHTGNLYKKVLEIENIAPEQLYHCGDNLHADIIMAKKHGIKTDYFTQAHLSYYERRFLRNVTSNNLIFYSKINAAGRLTRLNQSIQNEKPNILEGLASNIIAPFLTAFVVWVLNDAEIKGINKLYFVSRDGQIMYKIAQQLIKNKVGIVECCYLYGSRRAWFAASVCERDWKHMSWLIQGQNNRVSDFLERLCIAEDKLENHLIRYGLKNEMASQIEGEILERVKKFVLDEEVFDIIQSHTKGLQDNATGYFIQEGLFDEKRWALVDLGWSLNCQAALSRILKSKGRTKLVEGYYLGISEDAVPKEESGISYGWIVQNRKDTYIENYCHWLFRSNARVISEHIFTPADHNSVLAYKKIENKFVPIFAKSNITNTNQFVNIIHRIVLSYLSYIPYKSIENNLINYSKLAIYNAEHFFTNPRYEHVASISDLYLNYEQAHNKKYNRRLASKMTASELFMLLVKGKRFNHPKHVWLEGSAALSSPIIRTILRAVLLIRNTIIIYKI
jgi:predicted HAD superfamily hydrolase